MGISVVVKQVGWGSLNKLCHTTGPMPIHLFVCFFRDVFIAYKGISLTFDSLDKLLKRIWDTFYTKVPIERAYLWYVERMPTSLHNITS